MNSPYALVGPVLPQALRLARYQAMASLPENVDDISSENDVINHSPSGEEERLLASNAAVVIALENLFSWAEKDRTSRTSKLSSIESVRFQRAMYRIWLVSVLFGLRRTDSSPDEDEDEDESEEGDSEIACADLDKNWEDQKSFLEQFSSEELVQIDKVARFLVSIGILTLKAEERRMDGIRGIDNSEDVDDMFLLAGPHIILRCYEDATSEYLPQEQLDDDDGMYDEFLMSALAEILKARDKKAPSGYVGPILDGINGEHELCYHCGRSDISVDVPILSELYNETNWECLKGHPLESVIPLPGNLSDNLTENALRKVLMGDWSRLLHQLFPCKSEEYSKWSKEDWICPSCWYDFMCDTLWRWRLQQKRQAGETIKKNCKYGYDCRKQSYECCLAHLEQYNHLCEPAKQLARQPAKQPTE